MSHFITPSIMRLVLPVLYAVVIVAVLPLLAGYIVLMERKVMADMQARLGPMRVGPHGLLQPIADAVKLLLKEDIIPEKADRLLFWLAPLVSVTMALLAYAALPIGPVFQIADLNIGLLFILAVSSLGIYGIVLGGWASNSHYSLLGALRSAAQLVSYETAAGLGVISALLLAGSLSMRDIVMAQYDQGMWFIFYVPIGFFIYMVGSIAETNRAPFDLPEAESELVAGYMTEYSGFRWSLYFLAEYANMIIVAGIAPTLFLGGLLLVLGVALYCFFLAPKQPVKIQKLVMVLVGGLCLAIAGILAGALFASPTVLQGVHGAFWFMAKVLAYLYCFLWFRFTFPRYRFDQLMRLGWRFLIPLALVNLITMATALLISREWGWSLRITSILAIVVTLAVAMWLAKNDQVDSAVPVAEGE